MGKWGCGRALRRIGRLALVTGLAMSLGACAGLLPRATSIKQSPFESYKQAKDSFDSVVLGESTERELVRAGYAEGVVPNIRVLTYLDISEIFLPQQSFKMEDLDPVLEDCLHAQVRCRALEARPGNTNSRRYGNAFLDVFNFKRNTQETGWSATALFVLLDDVVVYKLWSGTPKIDETRLTVNPLGPIQDLGNIFNAAAAGVASGLARND